jgi:hypothetical protein
MPFAIRLATATKPPPHNAPRSAATIATAVNCSGRLVRHWLAGRVTGRCGQTGAGPPAETPATEGGGEAADCGGVAVEGGGCEAVEGGGVGCAAAGSVAGSLIDGHSPGCWTVG